MRHYWLATNARGRVLTALEQSCAACGKPLVPVPSPQDWRERVYGWGNADDCPGATGDTPQLPLADSA